MLGVARSDRTVSRRLSDVLDTVLCGRPKSGRRAEVSAVFGAEMDPGDEQHIFNS